MTLIWSAGSGASNPHYVGMNIWRSGIYVYCEDWAKATYPVADNQTLNRFLDGSSVGTVAYYKSGPAAVKIATRSFTGTPGSTYVLRAYLSGVYNGASPDLSRSVSIPVNPPAAPTGLVGTRISDGQINLAWSNTSPTSSTAPYTNVVVQRSVDDGSWSTVVTLGVVTSCALASVSADHKYEFRVYARNTSGSSSTTESNDVYTSPATPTIGAATKVGSDIAVTFDHMARYPTGARVFASQDGGAYATLDTVASGAETYVHVSPSTAVSWAYRVTATIGSLESAQSAASSTVRLLAAPLAPTALAPAVAVDATEGVTFRWQHNPVDTTAQTASALYYRQAGVQEYQGVPTSGATNVSGNVWEITVSGLVNDRAYEWQVATRGTHADWSPFLSPPATFVASARPTAAINTPGAVHNSSTLTVTWGYFDEEGTAQSQWRATLTGGTTEVRSEAGTAGETTFATSLPDGSSWDVTVDVWDGDGTQSLPDTVSFTVDYSPPATPTAEATWSQDTGSVVLEVTNPSPVSPEVAADHNVIRRSVDANTVTLAEEYLASPENVEAEEAFQRSFYETSVLVEEAGTLNTPLIDHIPAVGVGNVYIVTTVSETPSSAVSLPIIEYTNPHGSWVWLNWGKSFGEEVVRVKHGASLRVRTSREKVRNFYAGRNYPVETIGEERDHSLLVSARLGLGASTYEELNAMLDRPAPICYRDPTGRRWFTSADSLDHKHEGVVKTVSFGLQREDFYE